MNITKNREHRQTGQRVDGDARERCEARNEDGRWRSERSGRDTWKGAASSSTDAVAAPDRINIAEGICTTTGASGYSSFPSPHLVLKPG